MSDYQTTAPTTIPLTLSEAKQHLNVSSTADDAVITGYIKAATLMLENRCNRCFIKQTRTLKMDAFDDSRYVHSRRIYPPRSPLVNSTSLQSVKYIDTAGTTTTMPTTDYIWSPGDQPGFIGEAYNATWPSVYAQSNAVTITYVAGHSSAASAVPDNIKQAIRMVVGHWYRNREAVITGTISKEIELSVDALLESEATPTYG